MNGAGECNATSKDYASWSWKAGGAPTADNSAGVGATPTAGSVKIDGSNLGSALAGNIAATRISANTTAGFSIVKYTGDDSSDATIAHGLGVTPDLVVVKDLDATESWYVGSSQGMSFADSDYMTWDSNGGQSVSSTIWPGGSDVPTSSVFVVGTNDAVNGTDDYIAYCFASIEGYSKVGTYVGNGEASDNAFIYTGFRPAYFWGKWLDGANDWWIQDNKRKGYNVTDWRLKINANTAEENEYGVDFLSNGVKIRSNSGGIGQDGRTYLYMTFAESPFKTSNAR
jgi:hypothetical protein